MTDKAWKLIKRYNKGIVVTSEYRKKLIKKIRNNYTPNEYYDIEKTIEKLYWDMRNKLSIPNNKPNYETYDISELSQVKLKLKNDTYYRSFVNKLINIDDKENKIYYRKMEGSAKILNKDNFNLLTMTILLDKDLYYKIMNNKISVSEVKLPEYYIELDYGFPNLNFCKYMIGTEEFRKKKINNMFFCENCEKNWYSLIV